MEHAFLLRRHKQLKIDEEALFNFAAAQTIFDSVVRPGEAKGDDIADRKELRAWRKELSNHKHRFKGVSDDKPSKYELEVLEELLTEEGLYYRSGFDEDVLMSKFRLAALKQKDDSLSKQKDLSRYKKMMRALAPLEWKKKQVVPAKNVSEEIQTLRHDERAEWEILEIEKRVEEYTYQFDEDDDSLNFEKFCKEVFFISKAGFQAYKAHKKSKPRGSTIDNVSVDSSDKRTLEIGDWALKKNILDRLGHDVRRSVFVV